MKPYLITLLAVLALSVSAAEEPTQIYNGGEFSVEAFGGTITDDLDEGKGRYGFGVGYYITESLGARVRTTFENLSGHTFDNITLHGLWRVPIRQQHALYAFGGGTRVFHDAPEWSFELGPGYSYRPDWAKGFEGFGEIGISKGLSGPKHDASAIANVGVKFSF